MSLHVGASGAHKEVTAVSVGASGAWKAANDVWVGVGGVWKRALASIVPPVITPATCSTTGFETPPSVGAEAQFEFKSDGTWESSGTPNQSGQSSDTWLVSGNISDVEVMMTETSGTFSSGTIGSWLPADAGPYTWTKSVAAGGGTVTVSGNFAFRDANTHTALGNGTITLQAESS